MVGFVVQDWDKVKRNLELDESASFLDVRSACASAFGLPTAGSDLSDVVFKGKKRKDDETLAGAGVTPGAKMMLMLTRAGKEALAAGSGAPGACSSSAATGGTKKRVDDSGRAEPQNLRDALHEAGSASVLAAEAAGAASEPPRPAKVAGEVQILVAVGRAKHYFSLPPAAAVADLKLALSPLTGAEPALQRLLFKGKELAHQAGGDAVTLEAAGVSDGSKVLSLAVCPSQPLFALKLTPDGRVKGMN